MRRPGGSTRAHPAASRRPRGYLRRLVAPSSLASIVILLVSAFVLASPAGTSADSTQTWLAPSTPLTGRPFAGTPAVGALFATSAPGPASHFCTASVVHSPNRNLVITAAHCLASRSARHQEIAFVPGYHDRKAPFGVWMTARVVVDHAWESSADPDDDVAFIVVTRKSDGTRIEDVTGAEQLVTGHSPTDVMRVIGYPNAGDRPVTCQNHTSAVSATQLRFDCGGFPDGTSGGPFLADVSPTTGNGMVVGVIGGYQQGGYTPDISYSPRFRANVVALYRSAVAAS